MLSTLLGAQVRRAMLAVGRVVSLTGFGPNAFTYMGLLLNGLVGWVLAGGHYTIGGLLALFAGLFDMLDGAVARATGSSSRFGAFLDSTVDRYSEAVLLFGLLVHFTRTGNSTAVLLVYATAIGSLMISYARARSEAVGVANESGLLARPERVVLLGVLLIFEVPVVALWILAVGTNLTAIQRIYHVHKTLGP